MKKLLVAIALAVMLATALALPAFAAKDGVPGANYTWGHHQQEAKDRIIESRGLENRGQFTSSKAQDDRPDADQPGLIDWVHKWK